HGRRAQPPATSLGAAILKNFSRFAQARLTRGPDPQDEASTEHRAAAAPGAATKEKEMDVPNGPVTPSDEPGPLPNRPAGPSASGHGSGVGPGYGPGAPYQQTYAATDLMSPAGPSGPSGSAGRSAGWRRVAVPLVSA